MSLNAGTILFFKTIPSQALTLTVSDYRILSLSQRRSPAAPSCLSPRRCPTLPALSSAPSPPAAVSALRPTAVRPTRRPSYPPTSPIAVLGSRAASATACCLACLLPLISPPELPLAHPAALSQPELPPPPPTAPPPRAAFAPTRRRPTTLGATSAPTCPHLAAVQCSPAPPPQDLLAALAPLTTPTTSAPAPTHVDSSGAPPLGERWR